MTRTQAQKKISKLLALAGSPNQNEAFNALRMAQKLALQHDIDLDAEQTRARVADVVFYSGYKAPYVDKIASILGKNFRCTLYGRRNMDACVVGTKADVDAFLAAFAFTSWYFVNSLSTARKNARNSRASWTRYDSNAFRNSYMWGFVAQLSKAFATNVDEHGLVLAVNPDVTAYVNELNLSNSRTNDSINVNDSNAFQAGVKAALDMHKPTNQLHAHQGAKQLI